MLKINSKKRILQSFSVTIYFSLPTSEKTWKKIIWAKNRFNKKKDSIIDFFFKIVFFTSLNFNLKSNFSK